MRWQDCPSDRGNGLSTISFVHIVFIVVAQAKAYVGSKKYMPLLPLL